MVFSSFIPFLSLDFYDYSLSKKLITYFCCIFSDAEFLVLLFPIVKVNTMPDSLSIMFDVRIYRSFLRFILRLCRSEEHTSELQSRFDIVCRLLLEKKKLCNKS